MCHTLKCFTRNTSVWSKDTIFQLFYQEIAVIYIPRNSIRGFSGHFSIGLLFFTHFTNISFCFYLLKKGILFSLTGNSKMWSPWLSNRRQADFLLRDKSKHFSCGQHSLFCSYSTLLFQSRSSDRRWIKSKAQLSSSKGLAGGPSVKNLPASAGDLRDSGSISGSGGSSGGYGNPLQ